jgi:hypothetical protein
MKRLPRLRRIREGLWVDGKLKHYFAETNSEGDLFVPNETASRLLSTDIDKKVTSVSNLAAWIAGTANRVSVADDGDGSVTLSTPQDTHTGASPEFVTVKMSAATALRLFASDADKKLVSVADLTAWIAGTANRVSVANDGDGTITLSFASPTRLGSAAQIALGNYTEAEADGTLHHVGDATVWKDIMFPMAPPKTTGAGNPSLVTWNGSMRGFSFAVNDAHDFDPQEIEHDAKIGSTATWHIHFVSRDNETERTVKYELEYAIEPESGAIPAPTTVSAEFTIAASTTANTPQRGNITTFVIPGIAKLAYARITRIASSGAEPTTDPVVSGLHFHYELDTIGSREILTK